MAEVIIATGFVSFLIGFVTVLCVGNYYRAKKAMERQRQKRLARLSGNAGNGVVGADDSPRSDQSTTSSHFHDEQQNLLMGSRANGGPARRRPNGDEDALLLDVVDTGPRAQITAV